MGAATEKYLATQPAVQDTDQTGNSFTRALRQGSLNAGAGLANLAGTGLDAVGMPNVAQAAYGEAKTLGARGAAIKLPVASYKDIHGITDFSGMGSYVAGLAGQSVPALGAGLVGAALTKNPLVGMTLASTPFTAGEVATQQQADPVAAAQSGARRLGSALTTGFGNAAIGSIVPGAMGGKLLGKVGEQTARSLGTSIALNGAEGIGGNALAGGLTAANTQAAMTGLNPNRDKSNDMEQIKEAAIGGGAMGAGFGVLGVAGDRLHGTRPAPRTDGTPLGDVAPAPADGAQPTMTQRVAQYAKDKAQSVSDTAKATADYLKGNKTAADVAPADAAPGPDGGYPLPGADTSVGTQAGNAVRSAVDAASSSDLVGKLRDALKPADTTPVDLATGKDTLDPASLEGMTPEAQDSAIAAHDAGTTDKVNAMAHELSNDDGLSPESRAMLDNAMADTTDKGNQSTIAQLKVGQDNTVKIKGLIDDFMNAFGSDDDTPPSGIKLSAGGKGVDDAINKILAPAIAEKMPGAMMDQRTAARMSSVVKNIMGRMQDNGTIPDSMQKSLTRLLGDAAPSLLSKLHDSVLNGADPAKTEKYFSALNDMTKTLSQTRKLEDIVRTSLPENVSTAIDADQMGQVISHLKAFEAGTPFENMGPAQRAAKSQEFNDELVKQFGSQDKVNTVLEAVKASRESKLSGGKMVDDRAAGAKNADEEYDPNAVEDQHGEHNPDDEYEAGGADYGMSEQGTSSQFFGGGAKKATDKFVLSHKAHVRDYGHERSAEARIRSEVQTEHPDKAVSFVRAADYAREHGITHEELQGMTNGKPEDYGMVKAEDANPDGLAATKQDVKNVYKDKKYDESPSDIRLDDGSILDGKRLARMFADKGKLPFTDADTENPMHRLRRQMLAGISAMSDHTRDPIHVPDETVVATRGGKEVTWGEVQEKGRFKTSKKDDAAEDLYNQREQMSIEARMAEGDAKTSLEAGIKNIDDRLSSRAAQANDPNDKLLGARDKTLNDLRRESSAAEVQAGKFEDQADILSKKKNPSKSDTNSIGFMRDRAKSLRRNAEYLDEEIDKRNTEATMAQYKNADEAGGGKEGGGQSTNKAYLRNLESRSARMQHIMDMVDKGNSEGAVARLKSSMKELTQVSKTMPESVMKVQARAEYKELSAARAAIEANKSPENVKGELKKVMSDLTEKLEVEKTEQDRRVANDNVQQVASRSTDNASGATEIPLDRNIHHAVAEYGEEKVGGRFKASELQDEQNTGMHSKAFGEGNIDRGHLMTKDIDAISRRADTLLGLKTDKGAPNAIARALGEKVKELLTKRKAMPFEDQAELASIVKEKKLSALAKTVNDLFAKYENVQEVDQGAPVSMDEMMDSFMSHDELAGIKEETAKVDAERARKKELAVKKPKAFAERVLAGGETDKIVAGIKKSDDATMVQKSIDALVKHVGDKHADAVLDAANARMAEMVNSGDGESLRYNLQKNGNVKVSSMTMADVGKFLKEVAPWADHEFASMLHEGEFITDKSRVPKGMSEDLIRVSVLSQDPMGTAYHEALHAIFKKLKTLGKNEGQRVLEEAAMSPRVQKALREILHNEPDALKQLSDPEEAAAYMFQYHQTGSLGLATKPAGLLRKMAAFFRKLTGRWTNDERAVHIMNYFSEGALARQLDRGNMARIDRNLALGAERSLEPAKIIARRIRSVVGPLDTLAARVALTGDAQVRRFNNSALTDIINKVVSPLQGAHDDAGYFPTARAKATQYLNAWSQSIANHSEADITAALDSLHKQTAGATKGEREVMAITKKMLKDIHTYMKAAGVSIGDLGENYFPRVWDSATVLAKETEFRAMLENYRAAGKFKGSTDQVLAAITRSDGSELMIETAKPGNQFTKERVLGFISAQDAEPFLNKNLFQTVQSYATQGTRRAEWSRRFGDDGQRLTDKLQEARKLGATDDQIGTAMKYLKSVDGTLGDHLDPDVRRAFGNMMVYQNIRTLPLMIFSSMVDPGGILVRGGTLGDAFNAFKRGFGEVAEGWKSPGKRKDDKWSDMAQLIGAIDNATLMHNIGTSYSQGMTSNLGRKINDTLFKWNMAEQFNRSMRVAATQAAHGFILRHADGSGPHSVRWLAELGLRTGDVEKTAGGDLAMTQHDFEQAGYTPKQAAERSAQMFVAMNKWVDGAILRPNAAIKPIWMSDPHFALVAHLKQFTFAFQETILKRIVNEAKYGNYGPAYAMAAYLPVMLAADVMKGFITGGGSQPDSRKDWGMGSWLWYESQRTGLYGTAQFPLDVAGGIKQGGTGVGALAGPALEQMAEAVSVVAGPEQFSTMLVRALPANQLIKAAGEATSTNAAD